MEKKNNFQDLVGVINSVGKNNDIVVYTAIFGSYDKLHDPEIVEENVDYICFTDNKDLFSTVWFIIYVEQINVDPRMTAKYFKIMPHIFFPNHVCSIWIDGSIKITGCLTVFAANLKNDFLMSCIKHPQRNCAYKEALWCMINGKDSLFTITRQIISYFQNGFPLNFGLLCGGVLIRRHNSEHVTSLMNFWYENILNYSVRDQISLSYAIWFKKMHICILDIDLYNNEFFVVKKHSYIKYYDNEGKIFKNIFSILSSFYVKFRYKIKKIH